MSDVIVMMTRFPEVGKAKTRLIPHYGAEGALILHEDMTKFCLSECLALDCEIQVHYAGGSPQAMQDWLGHENTGKNTNTLTLIPQTEGHLGDRMFATLKQAFGKTTQPPRRQKIIIIGSDCPDNRRDNLRNIFELLDKYDLTIGPSTDGGYYLIAFAADIPLKNKDFLNKKVRPLFQDIAWGTDLVFAQSMEKIKSIGLNYHVLPMLSDVDLPQDVPQRISVIIPTFNEEENLHKLFASMPRAFNVEFIISDASDNDKAAEIATKYGAIYIRSAKGRSKQILAASQIASGEILFFLHADSILPPLWDVKIRQTLNEKNINLGHFKFGIAEAFWTKPIIEWGVNAVRCKYFKLPFGDQGLFVKKSDFAQWNLPEVPILEDVFLVKKAKEHGSITALPDTLYTSGRRWLKHGIMRTTFVNWCVLLAAKWGMDLEKIKNSYEQGQNPLWRFLSSNK